MLLHLCALVGNGRERGERQVAFCHLQRTGVGDEGYLAQAFKGFCVYKLHRVVLVALVPKTHTTVFRGTAPQVHGNGGVSTWLNLIAIGKTAGGTLIDDKLVCTGLG